MKDLIARLEKTSAALRDPEYLFLVLEPLQIWGVALGLVALAVTWVAKSERLQVASLVLIAVSALSVLPYLQAREAARPRIATVFSVDAPARAKGFQANSDDRLEHRWIHLSLAAFAAAAMLVGPRRNRLGLILALGTAGLSLQAIHYGLWMHYQDSLAYHPNLKQNEAPVKEKIRAEPRREPPEAAPAAPAPSPVLPVARPLEPSSSSRAVRPLAAGP